MLPAHGLFLVGERGNSHAVELALVGIDDFKLKAVKASHFVACRHVSKGVDNQAADSVEFVIAERDFKKLVEIIDFSERLDEIVAI